MISIGVMLKFLTKNYVITELIPEMLHIKKQKNSLNLQTDTEGLHSDCNKV